MCTVPDIDVFDAKTMRRTFSTNHTGRMPALVDEISCPP